MNILVDLAGIDLAYAMHYLFEVRLGHKLYWMTGPEWFYNGYCEHINEGISTQFLAQATGYMIKHDWHYNIITYREFLDRRNEFDCVMTLMQTNDVCPANINPGVSPFQKLIREQAPHMKMIRHIGNPWEVLLPGCCRNILMSITPNDYYCTNFTTRVKSEGRNLGWAHQEFNLDEFRFAPKVNDKRICSFQGGIAATPRYLKIFNSVRDLMPDFEWRMYGMSSELPGIALGPELGQAFVDSTFIWQTKDGEDGGGHLTHNAFATGRPLICMRDWYGGMMLDMLKDGETCIDLGKRTPQAAADMIREHSKPEAWTQMSNNVYNTFVKYCDYAKEAEDIKLFLERLQ